MDLKDTHLHTHSQDESIHEPALYKLLSNSLVWHQTIPYLPVLSVLSLASTSRSFKSLLHESPGVFRHLDLTTVKGAQLSLDRGNFAQHASSIVVHDRFVADATEDDVYSGPLRAVLAKVRQRDILRSVHTLVLDGLSVTAELLNDMLVDPSYPMRILSIRDCMNLNEAKLMQTLRFACRRGRAADALRLKGLYVFGSRDDARPITAKPKSRANSVSSVASSSSVRAVQATSSPSNDVRSVLDATSQDKTMTFALGDDWYHRHGRMISKKIADGWAETLLDCQSSMHFDAVLCTGPRHQNSPAFGRVPVSSYSSSARATPWAVATFAVGGCAMCGTAPEGFIVHGESPEEQLPLLAPLLVHSSNVKTACRPTGARSSGSNSLGGSGSQPRFVPRCLECIRERYCFSCDQWWCESCYQVPGQHPVVTPPLPQTTTTTTQTQHVHVVDQPGNWLAHELAAIEQPRLKVWSGYCFACTRRSVQAARRDALSRRSAMVSG